MVIISTSTVATIIHAVSPELSSSAAMASVGMTENSPTQIAAKRLFNNLLILNSPKRLQRFSAGFTSTDSYNLFNWSDKNLAITNLAGVGCAADGFDHFVL